MSGHRRGQPIGRRSVLGAGLLALADATVSACRVGATRAPITVGLVGPFSGRSAASSEAIQRGMLLAADEVNAAGGLLGRRLEIATRDVQNDPAAGVAALRALIDEQRVMAVFGGIYSPVMVAQLDLVHERRLPLVNPWGSLTAITRNGRAPNYAFRVSVSDEHADAFLARYAVEVVGARRPAILADSTAWGEANVAGLVRWLASLGVVPAGVGRFDQGDTTLVPQLRRVRAAAADALLLVADTSEGAYTARGMATLGWRVPVVSHWGISGGRFVELAGIENAEGVFTLQSHSFVGPQTATSQRVLQAYHARFATRRAEEVLAPVGVAHGFDGLRLLGRAVERAGTTDGATVRAALEDLGPYDGVVKRYDPPFTPERHDALVADDYLMAVWRNGRLVPATPARP